MVRIKITKVFYRRFIPIAVLPGGDHIENADDGCLEIVGVSFDSCITATLTVLLSITTPSSVSLLPISFALSCRTLNVLLSLFLSVGGVGVGCGEAVGGGAEQGQHAQSLFLRY